MAAEAQYFREAMIQAEPQFNPAKADRATLNSIFAWVWRDESMNYRKLDFDKGLFLYGSIGVGKTLTLLGLRNYVNGAVARHPQLKQTDYRLRMWWKSASELANIYSAEGQPALIQYVRPDLNLVIDELGREPNPASNFGTKMNVLQFVLQLRYDYRRTSVTHITTNMKLDEMANRYGVYVADRCLEMFNFIEFKGESYRKA